jgi:hypothetical protein
MVIYPTIGRIVHFYPSFDCGIPHVEGSPLSAMIVDVISENIVSLTVWDKIGHSYPFPGAALVQPEAVEKGDIPKCSYCTWMPFQVGQTPGSQELLNRIDTIQSKIVALETRLSGEVSPLAGTAPTSPPAPPAPHPKKEK